MNLDAQNSPPIPKIRSLAALARCHGTTRAVLKRAAAQGRLPIVQIGRLVYSTEEHVRELLTPRTLATAV